MNYFNQSLFSLRNFVLKEDLIGTLAKLIRPSCSMGGSIRLILEANKSLKVFCNFWSSEFNLLLDSTFSAISNAKSFISLGELSISSIPFSSKIFVSIGLISYSLYLWHYPIFAFGRTINNDPSIITKITWIILAFILSKL